MYASMALACPAHLHVAVGSNEDVCGYELEIGDHSSVGDFINISADTREELIALGERIIAAAKAAPEHEEPRKLHPHLQAKQDRVN